MVYLRSHRGEYLAVREDTNWGPGQAASRCFGLGREWEAVGGTLHDLGKKMEVKMEVNMEVYLDLHDLHDLRILSSVKS